MMTYKFLSLIFLQFILLAITVNAQETIVTARKKVNSNITVGGIVVNGPELGGIRYFQDHTGGLAAYDYTKMANVVPGDSIFITGKLVDYNNLLEISPVTSITVVSSGNQLYSPAEISIDQIGEKYEAQLVRINGVVFDNAGSTFQGNKNYNFRSNNRVGVIRVSRDSNGIIGQMIPSGEVDIVAICSQYAYENNDTLTGYQLLPRTMTDFITEGSIRLTSPVSVSNLSEQGFDLSWRTNEQGTSEVVYGFVNNPDSLIYRQFGTIVKNGSDFKNDVSLTGLPSGTIVFANTYTYADGDTAQSGIKPYATVSNSSGKMKAFFNTEVDHRVSRGIDAIYLNQAIDDTLISYINRAEESIDFTIYNYNNSNISDITKALNEAHQRGVKLRIISCGTANNFGFESLMPEVPYVKSPDSESREGIMHNKFVVFDAESKDSNKPVVWTGSTNFTDGQINTDPNNVIVIQDQSLALAFKMEFEEMWGSETEIPSPENARFGMFKKDDTPHEFIIGGKRVECYFSPSDGTNQKLLETIATADNDLSIATMLLTRSDLAYSLRDAKKRGVAVNVVTNAEGDNTDLVNEILTSSLGVGHFVYNEFVKGIMHHKYAIIDNSAPDSDPLLITGSHNWSASANDRNDENTLIIHDDTIANIYYQQFVKLFLDNNGSFSDINNPPVAMNDTVRVEMNGAVTVDVLSNDLIQGSTEISIEMEAKHGRVYIPFTNPYAIVYQAQNDFSGTDSIRYRVAYTTESDLFDIASVIVHVGLNNGVQTIQKSKVEFHQNSDSGSLTVFSEDPIVEYEVFDLLGSKLRSSVVNFETSLDISLLEFVNSGIILKVIHESGNVSIGKISLR